ncbi:ERCC4 domain-containing protein [bacterium]|nr:ERCC4 domain-containing protein [bacterium]
MTPPNFTIVVDSREQQPYGFDGMSLRATLPAGDYSVAGFEDAIAVERKTLEDYVRSVIRERERFHKEIARLSKMRFACIVVEASLPEMTSGAYRSGVNSFSVFEAGLAIEIGFGVPVHFCGDRQHGIRFTKSYLFRAAERLYREGAEEVHREGAKDTKASPSVPAAESNDTKACHPERSEGSRRATQGASS